MKQLQDEKIADGITALLCLACVLSTSCALGLVLTAIKGVLITFGIQNNL